MSGNSGRPRSVFALVIHRSPAITCQLPTDALTLMNGSLKLACKRAALRQLATGTCEPPRAPRLQIPGCCILTTNSVSRDPSIATGLVSLVLENPQPQDVTLLVPSYIVHRSSRRAPYTVNRSPSPALLTSDI